MMKNPEDYVKIAETRPSARDALRFHTGLSHKSITRLYTIAVFYWAHAMTALNDRVLTKDEESALRRWENEAKIICANAESPCTIAFDGDVRGILIRVHPRDKFSDNMGGGIGLI